MTDTYKVEKYKGYWLGLKQDSNPDDPRNWSNLGTMVCAHPRYELGDINLGSHKNKKHWSDVDEWLPTFYDVDDVREFVENNKKDIILPLYLYDHSGITMSTLLRYPYNDRWDAGTVGFIMVSREKVLKEYGWKHMTTQRRRLIESYLRAEVSTYDDYLTGEVYGWCVFSEDPEEDEDADVIYSVWGYYGEDGCKQGITEAKAHIDYLVEQELKAGIQLVLPDMGEYLPDELALQEERIGG